MHVLQYFKRFFLCACSGQYVLLEIGAEGKSFALNEVVEDFFSFVPVTS